MRTEEAFYNISMYLYNKNVLEYAQIARSGPKSMIRDIEGLSLVFIKWANWSFGYLGFVMIRETLNSSNTHQITYYFYVVCMVTEFPQRRYYRILLII